MSLKFYIIRGLDNSRLDAYAVVDGTDFYRSDREFLDLGKAMEYVYDVSEGGGVLPGWRRVQRFAIEQAEVEALYATGSTNTWIKPAR